MSVVGSGFLQESPVCGEDTVVVAPECALCCAVLCCAVLCCAVLCCAVLCCAVLCCAVLCRVCGIMLAPNPQPAAIEAFGASCRAQRQQLARACFSARAVLAVAFSDLETFVLQDACERAVESSLSINAVRRGRRLLLWPGVSRH